MGDMMYLNNYTPVGDLLVIAICIVMVVLIAASYLSRTKNFMLFMTMIGFLALAALCNVFLHYHYGQIRDGNYTSIYVLRIVFHSVLFSLFMTFIVYIIALVDLPGDERMKVLFEPVIIYIFVFAADIVTTVKGRDKLGMYLFLSGYIAFLFVIIVLLIRYRRMIYSKAMTGIFGSMGVSLLILFVQGMHGQTSYTVATFLFPMISIMYLLHSNPYDVELGALSASSVTDTIRYHYRKNNDFIFISLYLPDFDVDGKALPRELRDEIRKYSSEFYKKCGLFRISNSHMLLIAVKKANPDHRNKIEKMRTEFAKMYDVYRFDYKFIIGESIEEISRKNEYIRFIKSIQRSMPINTIHVVDEVDISTYNRNEYILSQLEDISRKRDLDDERVLVYCQPVYNIRKNIFDTAESLMRLKLPELGMVFPDQFIPLAEEHDYIHILTLIILKKSCDEVKRLLSEGYEVKRISVNVSVLELRDAGFISDIEKIITDSEIPDGKIAIEVTESQSDSDFNIIKGMMDELKGSGIKFYLDDFGTGYSNLERIMKLPFDIIKFDRSLVLACKDDDRSEKIVNRLASMFADLDYAVLYEGIENENDEERCIRMKASYLQGYKYSKPIPITDLVNFFSKGNK